MTRSIKEKLKIFWAFFWINLFDVYNFLELVEHFHLGSLVIGCRLVRFAVGSSAKIFSTSIFLAVLDASFHFPLTGLYSSPLLP